YMNLFVVPTGQYVTPFEDIYRGKTADGQPQRGPLLGVRAIAAKQLYREAGAQMDGICKELPNHIGVELAFMRFLCEREAVSLIDSSVIEQAESNDFSQAEIYRAYQIRFLGEHLTDWFPQLNEEIQKNSQHVFYQAIANITQYFLQQDLSRLKQQLMDSLQ
ncbi:MAG: molecular chaperone TorD family protein, partial [Gammaproteobacteria bacterium]